MLNSLCAWNRIERAIRKNAQFYRTRPIRSNRCSGQMSLDISRRQKSKHKAVIFKIIKSIILSARKIHNIVQATFTQLTQMAARFSSTSEEEIRDLVDRRACNLFCWRRACKCFEDVLCRGEAERWQSLQQKLHEKHPGRAWQVSLLAQG